MIARLRAAWVKAPWLMSAFTLAVALTLFFGIRMIMGAIYWADPRHIDQPIAGWMSPGYVSMSWQVPREVVADALALEPGAGRPPRLEDLSEQRGLTLDALAAEIEAAIQAHRDAAQ